MFIYISTKTTNDVAHVPYLLISIKKLKLELSNSNAKGINKIFTQNSEVPLGQAEQGKKEKGNDQPMQTIFLRGNQCKLLTHCKSINVRF
uniref:Uncharacterized protein n=1 Tax=Aegilops tauschii subsp. strangulata TaxID=200361 RepID=A0A453PNL3_AEGTS